MPALDSCEPQVIAALRKAGWRVVQNPYPIPFLDRFLLADLLIQTGEDQDNRLVVEVKCFSESSSLIEEFNRSVGQYHLYRSALDAVEVIYPLYLTVPLSAYTTFFSDVVVQTVVARANMKLLVVDIQREVIDQWIG